MLTISGTVELGNISGPPSSISLEQLTDVSISSPANGQFLQYNSGLWVNSFVSTIVGGSANEILFQSSPTTTSFIGAPSVANTYLQWSGSNFNWVSLAPGGVTSFNTRTGAVTLSSADVTTALGFTPINKAGDTVLGTLTFSSGTVTGIATPTNATDAATKAYVDAATSGLNVHASCESATTINLTATYTNGSPDNWGGTGIGATLTNS